MTSNKLNKRTKCPKLFYIRGQICYYVSEGNIMTLKELRQEYNLSQKQVSAVLGIPERSYRRYELDENYGSKIKREAFKDIIVKNYEITETKGVLTIEQIENKVRKLFEEKYKGQIDFCYLFGSYAKGLAKEESDVDLYVSTTLTGLRFVGLIENLRQTLNKKVDLIRSSELNNNVNLTNEIMKDGIKIYG